MKPVVRFRNQATFMPVHIIETGEDAEVALVYAIDHPRLGKADVRTSRIVQKFDDGSFETLNTIYKRDECPPCNDDCDQGRACPA